MNRKGYDEWLESADDSRSPLSAWLSRQSEIDVLEAKNEWLSDSLEAIDLDTKILVDEINVLKAENAYHYAALVELIKAGLNVMAEFQRTNPEISGSLYLALQEFHKKLYVDKFDQGKP